ncbi:hypothetical protein [Maribacter polysiphoniae]|uniref:nSTAND3 domain-containing NTPase n=1 Tax=Maribacter polysiphoniae TaxID=429344 RepID=UPI0023561975|nr:hypothetical protein [Maribacter polysiphoniae]
MTNDERRSYNNLILLCDEHHRIIDNKANEKKYSKKTLLAWKEEHISNNKKDEFVYDEDLITKLIYETQKYYRKIDALDGPYQPQVNNYYTLRGIEAELIQVLYENEVLLMTGVSFCGKSETARQISNYFFNKDYLFKRLLNVREAASFIESTGTKRICILEDPFGHTIENEDRSQLRLIRDLLNNKQKGNLLIITSRREIIHSVFNNSNLENCSINNHKWYDLTTNDLDFLKNLWLGHVRDLPILKENIDSVIKLIESGKTIQAGQLSHLSKLEKLSVDVLTEEDLYNLAQVDIDDICNDIIQRNDNLWEVLVTLGLGSNTKDGPSIEDLDYILQDTSEYLTLEIESSFTRSFLGKPSNEFVLPAYENSYGNISKVQDELDFLEQRGYMRCIDEIYSFSHPHYIEISKTLISKIGSLKQQKLISKVCNTLTCRNSGVAYNCSRNLGYILNSLNEQKKKELVSNVFKVSGRSFYPKVADQCTLFLTSIYQSQLIEEYKSNIIFKLQSKSEEYGITFIDEEPIRWKEADSFDSMVGLSKKAFSKLLVDLSNNQFLKTEAIWKGLLVIKNSKAEVDLHLLEYASKSNEVFVRNLCSYLFFLNVHKFYDSFLLDKLLTDEHPSVLFNGLKGYFQGIANNGKSLNKELAERFFYFFKNDEIFCIRASNLMSNFATDYAHDSVRLREIPDGKKKWAWRAWAKFFIQFLKVFPADVRFAHTPRFSSMMWEARKMIYPNQGVRIAKQMLKRLKEVAKSRLIDNFEMHLIDFLIESTSEKPELRTNLFRNFFDVNLPTYFVGHNIIWTFGHWSELQDDEKQIIYDALKKDREDSRWLKAIVLNNQSMPPESIQEIIFGNDKFMQHDSDWLIKNIDESLMLDTITVHLGNDSALQETGVPGSSKWTRDLIYHIARNNLPIEYEKCVGLFIVHFINCVPREEYDFYTKVWKEIYNNSPDKISLLDIIIKKVGKSSFCINETSIFFKIVIKYHIENNNINILSSKLAENFEALYYYTSDRDIFKVLDTERFVQDHLFSFMPIQRQILNIILSLDKKSFSSKDREECVSEIVRLSEIENIKLQWVFNIIKGLKEKGIIDSTLIKRLETIPNRIRENQENFHKKKSKSSLLSDFKYYYK